MFTVTRCRNRKTGALSSGRRVSCGCILGKAGGTVNVAHQLGSSLGLSVLVSLGQSPKDAIIAASIHRARPIVLTACAAILGMIPIASEIFGGPMAFAIIGSLAVATVLTLTLLPCAMSLLLAAEKQSQSAGDTCGQAEGRT
jgi:hypothetical protein